MPHPRLTIAPTRDRLLLEGRPFFWLADTVWAAFSCAAPDEWLEYLRFRRAQGFNVLQISVLPVLHDTSDTFLGERPYPVRADGSWDFSAPNSAWWVQAKQKVAAARAEGFTPALGALWNNYIAGTWAADRAPGVVLPPDQLEAYAKLLVETFGEFAPVWIVSGDTKFESDAITQTYSKLMSALKRADPAGLCTMHLITNGPLPAEIADSPQLDFYIFQSGHRGRQMPWMPPILAERFWHAKVKRPILNSEPCYEGHGQTPTATVRWSAYDVRRAAWLSLLAGASAGITYGAHGVWGWHRRGAKFNMAGDSLQPFDWRTALRFRGADDYAFIRRLYLDHGLQDCEPRNDLLLTFSDEGRLAACPDLRRIVLYTPTAHPQRLRLDASRYRWTGYNLETRETIAIEARSSWLALPEGNADIVYLGVKE